MSEEIAIQTFEITHQNVVDKQVHFMDLLDATFEVDAESVNWLFPEN